MFRSYILTLFVAIAYAGCQNPKPQASANAEQKDTVQSGKLQVRIGVTGEAFTTDSVLLSFTVTNHADTTQRFCKWETPFEPRLGKYFDITNDKGEEPTFKGAMARRVMPPPAESYIEVPPHDSVRTVINLATNYAVTAGQYTIKYSGGGVSGLEAGNELTVAVHTP